MVVTALDVALHEVVARTDPALSTPRGHGALQLRLPDEGRMPFLPRKLGESHAQAVYFFISLVVCLLFPCQTQVQAYSPFPDTGQTTCYDNYSELACPLPGQAFYGQDAQYQQRPRSYSKLGYGGVVLDDDALHVDRGGPWIMTRDNVTGLIWEIKTVANLDDTYSWRDAQSVFIPGRNVRCSGWLLVNTKQGMS